MPARIDFGVIIGYGDMGGAGICSACAVIKINTEKNYTEIIPVLIKVQQETICI